MVKKIILLLIISLIFIPTFHINAEEEYIPDDYYELEDELPEEVEDLLPDGIFSEDNEQMESAVNSAISWEYIIGVIIDLIGVNLGDIARVLATVSIVIVLSSLLSAFNNTIAGPTLKRIIELAASSVLVLTLMELSKEPLSRATQLFDNIALFVNTVSPVICGMYAMGGNVSSAIVHNYGLIVFLSITENICAIAVEIIISCCLALTLASAFLDNTKLSSLSSGIKGLFTFFIGFLTLIFTTVISSQSLLASKGDSLSAKTAKLLSVQIIPLVGNTIGESLKTAGASIEYLRSNVGIALVVTFILLVLPTIISIGLYRMVFIITNSLAGLLGCKKEGNIISELASIYSYVLAILCFCSLTLLFILTIFAKCASPLS